MHMRTPNHLPLARSTRTRHIDDVAMKTPLQTFSSSSEKKKKKKVAVE